MTLKRNWFVYLIIIGLIITLAHQCEQETKTVTTIEYDTVTDTINTITIQKVPTKVYVTKTKTIKGKDSIIYKSKPDSTTIDANIYKTELKSNNALANLTIVTSGELLDVSGTITYTQENKTVKTTKALSGKFIYAKFNVSEPLQDAELGVFMHLNNKIGFIGSVNYDGRLQNLTGNGFSAMAGLAIKF